MLVYSCPCMRSFLVQLNLYPTYPDLYNTISNISLFLGRWSRLQHILCSLFHCFSALELRLASGQNFDYETRTFYNLTFTVDDSMASTTSILYINIQNAFEVCYLDQSLYHVTAAEGVVRIYQRFTSHSDVCIIMNIHVTIGDRSFNV